MNLVAEFCYKDSYIRIGDFKYKSHYQYTDTFFNVEVKVDTFSGKVTFENTFKSFKDFVEDVELMYNFKKEKAIIGDENHGSYIELRIDKLGHIECFCQVYSQHRENELKLSFSADQTALLSFLRQLSSFVKCF